jgi:hypothetical protein
MRYRFEELFAKHGISANGLAKMSNGVIDASTLYRLIRRQAKQGTIRMIDGEMVEAIMTTLKVPMRDVIEPSVPEPRRKPKTR